MALYLHHLGTGSPAAYIDRGCGYAVNGAPLFYIDGMTAHARDGTPAYEISDVYFRSVDGRGGDLYFDPNQIDDWMINDLFAGSPWREHLESFVEKAKVERIAEVFPEYRHLFEEGAPADAMPADAMPADAGTTPADMIIGHLRAALRREQRPPPKKPFLQRFWDLLAHVIRWR